SPPSSTGAAPTGSVTFFVNGTQIGAPINIPAGNPPGPVIVNLTTSTLPQGSDILTAFYSGDPNYTSGTSAPVTEVIHGTSLTTTTLTSNPSSPTKAGQPITLTATVGPPAATGTVTFLEGSTVLSTVAVSAGQASFTVAFPTAGTHTYTAKYSGNSTYSPSSGLLTHVVQAAQTTTTLST